MLTALSLTAGMFSAITRLVSRLALVPGGAVGRGFRIGGVLLLSVGLQAAETGAPPDQLEFFEKRVRPILVERCHRCHSTGAERLRGGLLLDSREGLLKGGDSGPAVQTDRPEASRLLVAIRYENPDLQMPPTDRLAESEIADLTAWVKAGAPWPAGGTIAPPKSKLGFDLEARRRTHWSWRSIQASPPPAVPDRDWTRHPVDRFLFARLRQAGLTPSPPADSRTRLRRLTFDLTGLPPTPAEVRSFEEDRTPNAWERRVDALLASPRYGERWARHWLDLVRYAETLGHEFDYPNSNAWRYRDYVIRAFNADVPYRQFAREHIAGDLLPQPRRNPLDGSNESVIGTAFYWLSQRDHSPVDVKLHQAELVDNQIDVLSKTFLGLTVACARCHDHKFDAISTRDYYALHGMLGSSRYTQASLEPAGRAKATLAELTKLKGAIRREAGAAWAAAGIRGNEPSTTPGATPAAPPADVFVDFTRQGYAGWFVEGEAFGDRPGRAGDFMVGASDQPVLLLTEAAAHSGLISRRLQGVLRSPTFTLTRRYIHIEAAGRDSRLSLPVDNFTMIRDPIYGGLRRALDQDAFGWMTIDADMWKGHRAYLEFCDVSTPDPADGRDYGADGWIAVRRVVFSDAVTAPVAPGIPPAPAPDLASAAKRWSRGKELPESALLALARIPLPPHGEAGQRLRALWTKWSEVEKNLPEPRRVPGFAEGSGIDEHVFIRGNPRLPGEVVPRRFLEALGGTQRPRVATGSGRRELAEQMTDPDNPFFARVMVNRVWLHVFGRGLVPTPDDFGLLGQAPSHPDLLDWLAHWFRTEGQWSTKRLIRLLVTSRAYQMSSLPDDAQAETADPDNLLWHRMPVRRLEGEVIRDSILALAGRLDTTMFGPPVAVHLTEFMDGRGRPSRSGPLDGDGRRSIYQEVRRNFLSPLMRAFDTPVPFTTVGRRTVSNVPAQSLILMNDPFVREQAGRWAEHLLRETDRKPSAALELAFLAALGRAPTPSEIDGANAFLAAQRAAYGLSETAEDPRVWADLCHALLNAKEFILLN